MKSIKLFFIAAVTALVASCGGKGVSHPQPPTGGGGGGIVDTKINFTSVTAFAVTENVDSSQFGEATLHIGKDAKDLVIERITWGIVSKTGTVGDPVGTYLEISNTKFYWITPIDFTTFNLVNKTLTAGDYSLKAFGTGGGKGTFDLIVILDGHQGEVDNKVSFTASLKTTTVN